MQWTWGSGRKQQLGFDLEEAVEPIKVAVAALEEASAVAVACCASSTAVLTDAGEVVTWGETSHGQLGRASSASYVGVVVDNLPACPVVQIACGRHHMVWRRRGVCGVVPAAFWLPPGLRFNFPLRLSRRV